MIIMVQCSPSEDDSYGEEDSGSEDEDMGNFMARC